MNVPGNAKKGKGTNPSASSSRGRRPPKTKPADTTHPPASHPSSTDIDAASPGIVMAGVGASAGGLEAFKKFFAAMPADSGVAFVLIQHLDPTHESLTAELLVRYTDMKVVQIEDRMRAEPNRVYVIPPNKYLAVSDSVLHLTEPIERRGMRTPIDYFFRSLAEEHKERAICIILSGTGSDGVLGLKAVKGHGGMAMAQAPESAQYDGMPRNAIATGLVDFVLPVEKMPEVLIKYVRHPYINGASGPKPLLQEPPDHLNAVLAVLRARTRYDFQCYKKSTLTRRVARRMGLKHIERASDYLSVLHKNHDEVMQLFQDLLIGVTGFFREPEAFRALEKDVIPRLVQAKRANTRLRVWVPGCATGEEPYSIAMLLIEQLSEAQKDCDIQVFATDINEEALEFARAGRYPESIAADVAPAHLRRFFSKEGDSYRVDKQLRESVVFAVQNLISDSPFSKLDLISCRNLLIYLEPEVQKKVLSLFHFALNEGGYLFLGGSETVGRQDDLFEAVSKKWRVYRRLGVTQWGKVDSPIVGPKDKQRAVLPSTEPAASPRDTLGVMMQEILVQECAPAAVLINRKYEALYIHGPTSEYLEIPAGEPTHDLMAMVRGGLRERLRGAVHKAVQQNERVVVGGMPLKRDGKYRKVKVSVKPVRTTKAAEGLLLITFEDEPETGPTVGTEEAGADESLMRHLEAELKATREDLQNTIEMLETSNEELKASNEEAMSANEELQSSNEELETSKEEMQSLNEELNTVNSQLRDKVDELEAANNDLDNLLTSTNIATLFLDTNLCVRWFTPATTRLFNLIPSDRGRLISDITPKFIDEELLSDAAAVLKSLIPVEKEIESHEGRWYIRQVLPYRTHDNRIDGVVITFSDLAADAVQEARLYSESIIDTMRNLLLVLDTELRVQSANRAFYETFQVSPEETKNRLLYELGDRQWDIPELRNLLEKVLPNKEEVKGFEVTHDFERIGFRTILLNARFIVRPGNRPNLILLAMEDITERKRAARTQRDSDARVRNIVENAPDGIITIDEGGIVDAFNPAAERIFGYTAGEVIGQNVRMLMPSPYHEEHDGYLASYRRTGQGKIIGIGREVVGRRKDGSMFPIALTVSQFLSAGGPRFTGIVRDITKRRQAEEETRRHEAELAHMARVTTIGALTATLAHDLNQPICAMVSNAQAAQRMTASNPPRWDAVHEALKDIVEDGMRTGEIIHGLRELLQKGHRRPTKLDINAVIREAGRLIEADARQHRAKIRFELGEGLAAVFGDRVQVQQVVLNLADNGLDAMADVDVASRELVIRTSKNDAEGVLVAVSDVGAGLSKESSARLFEPFFTTKPEGLGMGLKISRSIVESMGGQLWATPNPDRGTTFQFTLPEFKGAPSV